MEERKEKHFSYRRIPNNRCKRNGGNRESPIEHICCRQDPLTNDILSGQNFKEK